MEEGFPKPTPRENLIDLHYGHQETDKLTFEAPSGYQWESFPTPRSRKDSFAVYELSTEKQGSDLRLKRAFNMNAYFFLPKEYPDLHRFFDDLRKNDDEQATLHTAAANVSSSLQWQIRFVRISIALLISVSE